MRKNEQGFGVVVLLLVIVVFGVLCVVGWRVFSMQNAGKNGSETKNNTKQNTEQTTQALTKPVGLTDAILEGKKDIVQPKKIDGTNYLVIDDWGVKVPLSAGDSEIFLYRYAETYADTDDSKTYMVSLTDGCFLNGTLERVKVGDPTYMDTFVYGDDVPTTNYDGTYPKVNGYYYLYGYGSGKAACDQMLDSKLNLIQSEVDKRNAAEEALLQDYKNISAN